MTDLSVHQDPYLDQPQQPPQLSAQPPGTTFSILTVYGMFLQLSLLNIWFAAPSTTTAKGKKRGRPPKGEGKEKTEAEESAKKAKRTLNRFNGMSVEEVMTRKLPDVITHNLDMLIVSFCFILSAFMYSNSNLNIDLNVYLKFYLY